MWLQGRKFVYAQAFINLLFAILLTTSIRVSSDVLFGFLAGFLFIFVYYEI